VKQLVGFLVFNLEKFTIHQQIESGE